MDDVNRGAVYGERIISIIEVHNSRLAAETFHYTICASVIETCYCHEGDRDTGVWIENKCLYANVKVLSFF